MTPDSVSEILASLRRFKGQVFVVKYGGSFMDSPDAAVRNGVARDIVVLAQAGIRPVVVHGGGKAITRAMDAAGLKANFIQGMRVTDEATVAVVDRVLSREINPEVVAAINSFQGNACGFPGTHIFTCSKLLLTDEHGNKIDIGNVGEVTGVKKEPLLDCLAQGMTPVISPTALGPDGKVYNCNADVAAAHVAVALSAMRLIFMSDVPGLLRDPKNPASIIKKLSSTEADGLKRARVIDKGMIPKVESAVAAARAGVGKVSFVDGRVRHAILLETSKAKTQGTEIVAE